MRILLSQLRRIGDVLMTTPAVAAVRKAYPEAHITYLTEKPSHLIFAHNPHVDEVLCWPKGGWARLALLRRLRKRRFDLAVDFFCNPRSAMMIRLSGARRRIGFDFSGRRYAYTERVKPGDALRYAGQDKVDLLGPLGIGVQHPRPELFLGDAERQYAKTQLEQLGVRPGDLLVALCPVSRQPYKVWPAKDFARLADILIERYQAKIMFFSGPGEQHFIDQVRLEMHHASLPDYPIPDLLQMGALLEQAHLYVGNDNGPRHFALALGTPTVTVFGRPFPQNWTPPPMPGETPRHLTADFDPGCKATCHYPRCELECIKKVPYEKVQSAAEILLEEILKNGTPA